MAFSFEELLGDHTTELFSNGDLTVMAQNRLLIAKAAVEQYDPKSLIQSADAVADLIFEEYELRPITLQHDGTAVTGFEEGKTERLEVGVKPQFSRMLNVDAASIDVQLHYEGSPELLMFGGNLDPNLYTEFKLLDEMYITFNLVYETPTPEALDQDVKRTIARLMPAIEATNVEAIGYNEGLSLQLRQLATARRERLMRNQDLNAALPFQLVRRKGAEPIIETLKAKPIKQLLKAVPSSIAEERILEEATFQDVIETIQSMTLLAERTPDTIALLSEETLRNILLMMLNGTYNGEVSGETFNMHGKTDILLKHNNRTLFIGECKFWDGQTTIQDALDKQLLRYIDFRTTRAALVVFFRNQNPGQLLERGLEVMRSHANFIEETRSDEHNYRWDFSFRSLIDEHKKITLAFVPVLVPVD